MLRSVEETTMSREFFNHTSRPEAAMVVAFDQPHRQTELAGGAWIAPPALVRSRI
jgi:hypothetical protein